jgi:hypothetical protein
MWHPWPPCVRALCHGLGRVGGHGPHIEGTLAESLSAGGHAEGLAGPVQVRSATPAVAVCRLTFPPAIGPSARIFLRTRIASARAGASSSSTLGRTRSFAVGVLLSSQTTRATPYRSSLTIR